MVIFTDSDHAVMVDTSSTAALADTAAYCDAEAGKIVRNESDLSSRNRLTELIIYRSRAQRRIRELEDAVRQLCIQAAHREKRVCRDGPHTDGMAGNDSESNDSNPLHRGEVNERGSAVESADRAGGVVSQNVLVETIDALQRELVELKRHSSAQLTALGESLQLSRCDNSRLRVEKDALTGRVAEDVLRQRQMCRIEVASEKVRAAACVRLASRGRLEALEATLMEAHDELYYRQRYEGGFHGPVREVVLVLHYYNPGVDITAGYEVAATSTPDAHGSKTKNDKPDPCSNDASYRRDSTDSNILSVETNGIGIDATRLQRGTACSARPNAAAATGSGTEAEERRRACCATLLLARVYDTICADTAHEFGGCPVKADLSRSSALAAVTHDTHMLHCYAFGCPWRALHYARSCQERVTAAPYTHDTLTPLREMCIIQHRGTRVYAGPRFHSCVYATTELAGEVDVRSGRMRYYGKDIHCAVAAALKYSQVGVVVANRTWVQLLLRQWLTRQQSSSAAVLHTPALTQLRERLLAGDTVVAADESGVSVAEMEALRSALPWKEWDVLHLTCCESAQARRALDETATTGCPGGGIGSSMVHSNKTGGSAMCASLDHVQRNSSACTNRMGVFLTNAGNTDYSDSPFAPDTEHDGSVARHRTVEPIVPDSQPFVTRDGVADDAAKVWCCSLLPATLRGRRAISVDLLYPTLMQPHFASAQQRRTTTQALVHALCPRAVHFSSVSLASSSWTAIQARIRTRPRHGDTDSQAPVAGQASQTTYPTVDCSGGVAATALARHRWESHYRALHRRAESLQCALEQWERRAMCAFDAASAQHNRTTRALRRVAHPLSMIYAVTLHLAEPAVWQQAWRRIRRGELCGAAKKHNQSGKDDLHDDGKGIGGSSSDRDHCLRGGIRGGSATDGQRVVRWEQIGAAHDGGAGDVTQTNPISSAGIDATKTINDGRSNDDCDKKKSGSRDAHEHSRACHRSAGENGGLDEYDDDSAPENERGGGVCGGGTFHAELHCAVLYSRLSHLATAVYRGKRVRLRGDAAAMCVMFDSAEAAVRFAMAGYALVNRTAADVFAAAPVSVGSSSPAPPVPWTPSGTAKSSAVDVFALRVGVSCGDVECMPASPTRRPETSVWTQRQGEDAVTSGECGAVSSVSGDGEPSRRGSRCREEVGAYSLWCAPVMAAEEQQQEERHEHHPPDPSCRNRQQSLKEWKEESARRNELAIAMEETGDREYDVDRETAMVMRESARLCRRARAGEVLLQQQVMDDYLAAVPAHAGLASSSAACSDKGWSDTEAHSRPSFYRTPRSVWESESHDEARAMVYALLPAAYAHRRRALLLSAAPAATMSMTFTAASREFVAAAILRHRGGSSCVKSATTRTTPASTLTSESAAAAVAAASSSLTAHSFPPPARYILWLQSYPLRCLSFSAGVQMPDTGHRPQRRARERLECAEACQLARLDRYDWSQQPRPVALSWPIRRHLSHRSRASAVVMMYCDIAEAAPLRKALGTSLMHTGAFSTPPGQSSLNKSTNHICNSSSSSTGHVGDFTTNGEDMDVAPHTPFLSTMPTVWQHVLCLYHRIVQEVLWWHDGCVIASDGVSGYGIVFGDVGRALRAAVAVLQSLHAAGWPDELHRTVAALRVRDCGDVEKSGRLLFHGPRPRVVLHMSSRVCRGSEHAEEEGDGDGATLSSCSRGNRGIRTSKSKAHTKSGTSSSLYTRRGGRSNTYGSRQPYSGRNGAGHENADEPGRLYGPLRGRGWTELLQRVAHTRGGVLCLSDTFVRASTSPSTAPFGTSALLDTLCGMRVTHHVPSTIDNTDTGGGGGDGRSNSNARGKRTQHTSVGAGMVSSHAAATLDCVPGAAASRTTPAAKRQLVSFMAVPHALRRRLLLARPLASNAFPDWAISPRSASSPLSVCAPTLPRLFPQQRAFSPKQGRGELAAMAMQAGATHDTHARTGDGQHAVIDEAMQVERTVEAALLSLRSVMDVAVQPLQYEITSTMAAMSSSASACAAGRLLRVVCEAVRDVSSALTMCVGEPRGDVQDHPSSHKATTMKTGATARRRAAATKLPRLAGSATEKEKSRPGARTPRKCSTEVTSNCRFASALDYLCRCMEECVSEEAAEDKRMRVQKRGKKMLTSCGGQMTAGQEGALSRRC